MKTLPEQILFDFLQDHYDPQKPVLIGLSGGPDSLALLYLCLQYKAQHPLQLGLAHVDHGWREESAQEAVYLEKLAKQLGLPFYLKTIHPSQLRGNLESASRQERLAFFEELCRRHHYQAVMLGHHADDQAETVLKRVLEGASLPYLSGLRPETSIQELKIWRPFIQLSKSTILQWLEAHQLVAFEDRTNLDPRFLRGRFRTQILPYLAQTFGKNASQSLCRIGADAQELAVYLDGQLKSYLQRIEKSHRGTFLDLSSDCPKTAFEIKYLIRKLCETEGFSLSYPLVETACRLIQSKKADAKIEMDTKALFFDRGRIFIMHADFTDLPPPLLLQPGTFHYGDWLVSVHQHAEIPEENRVFGWKTAWEGKLAVWLPAGSYHLGQASMDAPFPGNSPISKWWTDAKVPAFLRRKIPVIWEGNRICHEFLTAKGDRKVKELYPKAENGWLQIKLMV